MVADVNGLSLVDAPDPHGNGQPTKSVLYTDPASGDVVTLGVYVSQHGGQRLRVVHGNPSPSDKIGLYAEQDAQGRMVVNEL